MSNIEDRTVHAVRSRSWKGCQIGYLTLMALEFIFFSVKCQHLTLTAFGLNLERTPILVLSLGIFSEASENNVEEIKALIEVSILKV